MARNKYVLVQLDESTEFSEAEDLAAQFMDIDPRRVMSAVPAKDDGFGNIIESSLVRWSAGR